MDVDTLGPGPDLAAIDFSKLDMGNELPGEKPLAPEATAEAPEATSEAAEAPAVTEEAEAPAEATEATEEAPEKTEPPRDESGKFAKKEKADTRVPKSRFDEAVAKERDAKEAAEKRAEELERQLSSRQKQAQQTEQRDEKIRQLDAHVDELTRQHTKHLLDGEADKASELMKEIRQQERSIARMEAQDEARTIADQTIEADRLNLAIAKLEAEHAVLNPKSEQYDDDLVQTILLWQVKGIESGMRPAHALVTATEKVLGKYYKVQDKQEADPAEEAKEGLGKQVETDRKKSAVEKALATSKSQPVLTSALGVDSDKAGQKALPDVGTMTSEEFAALPEATRARLRGDLL